MQEILQHPDASDYPGVGNFAACASPAADATLRSGKYWLGTLGTGYRLSTFIMSLSVRRQLSCSAAVSRRGTSIASTSPDAGARRLAELMSSFAASAISWSARPSLGCSDGLCVCDKSEELVTAASARAAWHYGLRWRLACHLIMACIRLCTPT